MAEAGQPSILFARVPAVRARRELRQYARHLAAELAGGRSFTCLITGDAELRRLNAAFLGKDAPTDVLSFPSTEPDEGLGEIAISADRARLQAGDYGHSLDDEIRILMLHGLLHLLGMDHTRDRGRMRRTESQWRRRLGLPPALIERSAGSASR